MGVDVPSEWGKSLQHMYRSPDLAVSRAGCSYENDETRTCRWKYSLGFISRGASGRPLMAVVKFQPPSSISRYCGTQIDDSSTIPIRSPGCRASVPLTMRSVTAKAGCTHRKI